MSYSIEPDYNQQYLFPPRLEDLLPKNHPARFIRLFVDSLKLEEVGFSSSPGRDGRPHYSNSMKLKIWLYGYFRKIYSTRQLEDACRNDIGLLWLTGMHYPDHNTLWSFFDSNRRAIRNLFKKVTETALKADLIGLVLHALDGTKIQAKVSTRTGWNLKQLSKIVKDVDSSIEEIMKKIRAMHKGEAANFKLPEELEDQMELKKKIESILSEMNDINRQHLHKDDKDARMMKNGKTSEFCYNSQAVVDGDSNLIVAEDVTNAEKDNNMLVPMIENGEENLGALAEETLADGGYYAPEQLIEADVKGIGVLVNLDGQILPKKDNKFHKSNFIYDKEKDVFICPMGKELTFERIKHGPKRRRDIRIYRCHHKRVCMESNMCSRDKRGRSIEKEPYYELLQRQIQKQKNPGNKEILAKRKTIVEPVFGIIKEVLGFRCFTVRGLENVKTQWSLICTTFNLRKLFGVWISGKLVIA